MDYNRIEIAVKPHTQDPFARHAWWKITSSLDYRIKKLRLVTVYTVYSAVSKRQLHYFAEKVLCDPVLAFYTIDAPIAPRLGRFDWAVEVSFKKGVTDNVGRTASDVLNMMVGTYGSEEDSARVYNSTQYLIQAPLEFQDVEKISREVLYNPLIQEIEVMKFSDLVERGGFGAKKRRFAQNYLPKVQTIDLDVSDQQLIEISENRVLALSLEEMKFFRSYFQRPEIKKTRAELGMSAQPTDVEIECFAQTQSEHCKHKIFNATISYTDNSEDAQPPSSRNGRVRTIHSLFKTYIQSVTERLKGKKDFLVSVFRDNAGVVRFDEHNNLTFKVETHNSPSALDPYGGAITGIVGVDRDPAGTGIGSRIIAHTDVLCFGDPRFKGKLPPRMMHPRRIAEGVIKGIEDGGNKCGIPTINGGIIFDGSYSGKPLVFCGSVGIMPARIGSVPTHHKKIVPGDIIVMVGGRIGKDGIHGATFSSEEIKESSPAQAVQIGDPITQKKMLDMLLEARDMLLYRAITDNGAGGLSSSVGEMALLSGGAFLELEKAPLKYPGLDPWEILLSEAQERMSVAVPPENLEKFLHLARKRDVLATPMGKFTDTGYFHVTYRNNTVCCLELKFLHSDIPLSLEAEWRKPGIEEKDPEPAGELDHIIPDMVADLNSCSREPVIRRYDHEVGGSTVLKPLIGTREIGPSDGGVIAPVPGKKRGFVLSCGINPFYSRVDTYHMAAAAVDEAVRNAVAVGADPRQISLLDNFCWPDPVHHPHKTPDGKYKLAQLVRAAQGLHDTAEAFQAPFISGKDSMKNDYKIGRHKVSVLPTILVSALGIVPDVTKCISSDFKKEGDIIYLMGRTGSHMGQSLFYRKYGGSSASIPVVDTGENIKVYTAYYEGASRELITSGHDLSEGGLAVAVAEACIG
ncbi:MAG: AIR synthase-related protein, partial [Spirochaetota bacterium]